MPSSQNADNQEWAPASPNVLVRLRLLRTTDQNEIRLPHGITRDGQPALDSKVIEKIEAKPQELSGGAEPIDITAQGNNKPGRGRNDGRHTGPVYLKSLVPQTASPPGPLELN